MKKWFRYFFQLVLVNGLFSIFFLNISAAAEETLSPQIPVTVQQSELVEPEFATIKGAHRQTDTGSAIAKGKIAHSNTQMVVAAHPLASKAGVDVLNVGGNAVDAMVAVQAVLGLVEPQSSGLGGGAFTLFYDAEEKTLSAFDGRETAPLNAHQDLFLKPDQNPMAFFDAVVGGRSVGTPGTVALLWKMHQQYGRLDWQSLLAPAIAIATDGFTVSPRMAASIKRDKQRLLTHAITAAYFVPNGKPLDEGAVITNPAYAETLRLLAKHGGDYFYSEAFASKIVKAVRNAANPGTLSLEDFATYTVIARAPTCSSFAGFEVCGMGAPSSGALTVGQILGISEQAGLLDQTPDSTDAWHIIAEATRLAFADRGLYIADPQYFEMPSWLLDARYLAQRAKQVSPSSKSEQINAGSFGTPNAALTNGVITAQPSTSHFSIVDKDGNIISSTTTIENAFGSRVMVGGFLLNNELTDFSFNYKNENGLIANRVQPGKRPRSSMAPTVVFKHQKPVLVIGSPGGSRIINYVANALVRALTWEQPLYEALNAPHISNRYGDMDIEKGRWSADQISQFESMGYTVNERALNSGLHAILINQGQLTGAADQRREGVARY